MPPSRITSSPPNSAHAYDVRFEHVPCIPARVFNQILASVVALVSAALAATHAGALPKVHHASHCSHSENRHCFKLAMMRDSWASVMELLNEST